MNGNGSNTEGMCVISLQRVDNEFLPGPRQLIQFWDWGEPTESQEIRPFPLCGTPPGCERWFRCELPSPLKKRARPPCSYQHGQGGPLDSLRKHRAFPSGYEGPDPPAGFSSPGAQWDLPRLIAAFCKDISLYAAFLEAMSQVRRAAPDTEAVREVLSDGQNELFKISGGMNWVMLITLLLERLSELFHTLERPEDRLETQ